MRMVLDLACLQLYYLTFSSTKTIITKMEPQTPLTFTSTRPRHRETSSTRR